MHSALALTPLIAIQLMGLQYARKERKRVRITGQVPLIPEDSDEIIEIEEE